MIKVSIGESKEYKFFPKLMKSDEGRIVFMIKSGEGFQLNTAMGEEPHFCESWIMRDFTELNEPVTLQNL